MPHPAEIPPLIGVEGIARLFGVPPNTAYSWVARGQLGKADVRVSRRSMWFADRFPVQDQPLTLDQMDKGPRPPLAVVLVGLGEIAEAFRVKAHTVEAWRRRTRDLPATDPLRPPDPVLVVGGTSVWRAADWLPYADARGKAYHPPTLAAWRRRQERVL